MQKPWTSNRKEEKLWLKEPSGEWPRLGRGEALLEFGLFAGALLKALRFCEWFEKSLIIGGYHFPPIVISGQQKE